MGLNWRDILDAAIKVIGFILSVGISVGVIYYVHRTMSRLLQRLIGDEIIARGLTSLGVILLALQGAKAALRYITQNDLRYLHSGLMDLLLGMAGVVQWLALIAVLLFVAYTLRGWRGPTDR